MVEKAKTQDADATTTTVATADAPVQRGFWGRVGAHYRKWWWLHLIIFVIILFVILFPVYVSLPPFQFYA